MLGTYKRMQIENAKLVAYLVRGGELEDEPTSEVEDIRNMGPSDDDPFEGF